MDTNCRCFGLFCSISWCDQVKYFFGRIWSLDPFRSIEKLAIFIEFSVYGQRKDPELICGGKL